MLLGQITFAKLKVLDSPTLVGTAWHALFNTHTCVHSYMYSVSHQLLPCTYYRQY